MRFEVWYRRPVTYYETYCVQVNAESAEAARVRGRAQVDANPGDYFVERQNDVSATGPWELESVLDSEGNVLLEQEPING